MAKRPSFNPKRIYVHLEPGGDTSRLDTTRKDFWSTLGDRELDGRLLGMARMSRNTAWEMHPDGDEILFLVEGTMELVRGQVCGFDSTGVVESDL